MKKAILTLSIILSITSCGSKVNYLKETKSVELKQPFKEKDYQDSDTEFYSIRNSVGTNLNAIKADALAAAQADFSQRIVVSLKSIAELKLTNKDEVSTSNFSSSLNAIGSSSVKKIKIIDSKIYTRGVTKGQNQIKYDYWVVYRVDLSEVIKNVNNSNLGFSVSKDDF